MLEKQWNDEGYKIDSYFPVTFKNTEMTLSFSPDEIPGWKKQFKGISANSVRIVNINYYPYKTLDYRGLG